MSRGGKRPGAGRPLADPFLKKVPVNYKLPQWLVDWIREQNESGAVLIEDALVKQHNLK